MLVYEVMKVIRLEALLEALDQSASSLGPTDGAALELAHARTIPDTQLLRQLVPAELRE
jgi:hypothetical protein